MKNKKNSYLKDINGRFVKKSDSQGAENSVPGAITVKEEEMEKLKEAEEKNLVLQFSKGATDMKKKNSHMKDINGRFVKKSDSQSAENSLQEEEEMEKLREEAEEKNLVLQFSKGATDMKKKNLHMKDINGIFIKKSDSQSAENSLPEAITVKEEEEMEKLREEAKERNLVLPFFEGATGMKKKNNSYLKGANGRFIKKPVSQEAEADEKCGENNELVITSEMVEEERLLEAKAIEEEKERMEKLREKEETEEKCYKRLKLLLSRSSIYAQFMSEKLKKHDSGETMKVKKAEESNVKRKKIDSKLPTTKKQKVKQELEVYRQKNMAELEFQSPSESFNTEKDSSANTNGTNNVIQQPSLFYGGTMRSYQIEGYEWLKVLYENAVNGILADEMGLGKTIQCIAFIANLIEMGVSGPFFICAPLSTLPNWLSEFKRFTPDIPVLLYHGHYTDRWKLIPTISKKVEVNKKMSSCPVVLTSYQIALIDVKKLRKPSWKLLVVDEGHRIKNFECALAKAFKLYNADQRLLLTGTPLQNNLTELWSLLNFILPEVFDDLHVFQSWFDIKRISYNDINQEIVEKEQEKQLVSIIHQILTPFLLRRTKSEVELELPPKKEIVVHAPFTSIQQEYYRAVIEKAIPSDLFDSLPSTSKRIPKQTSYFGVDTNLTNIPKHTDLESNDDSIFSKARFEVNLKLQNPLPCLRKIVAHPYLVARPLNNRVGEDFVNASGKLLVLDALLKELKKRNHKVIIFSGFVSLLILLEEYCDFRGFEFACLHGIMSLEERQEQLSVFKKESTFLFLISTRAGGLGLNIVEADTVIIYDSEWNPQCDLQAQDRCHRIGQNKPVAVYRLIVPGTIDEKVYQYSTGKRKLEKVIIQKGRFVSKDVNRSQTPLAAAELLELLEASDNIFIKSDDNCVLSPDELNRLMDRSNYD